MPSTSVFMLATDREVQNAKLRGGRAEYRVRGVKNLVLRVTAKGSSWVFLYTSPRTGKHCKLAIGSYPATSLGQAKDDALGLTRAVRHGHDPLLERRTEQAAETFRALAERYMAEQRRKNVRGERQSRWTGEVQRLLEADILPTIGAHKAKAVTKHDVMGVVEAVADRGAHVLADKVLALIRSIYNWAGATGRLDINPTFGMRKRNVGKARQRTLSEVEIRELWLALKAPTEFSHEISDALRLQLLLGVRIGEVLGASKGEIDLVKQVWVIPAIRTKSHREHRLPLVPLAVSILQAAIERASTSAWLFPSQLDDRPMRPKSAMQAMLRLRSCIDIAGVRTHDLRRTFATGLGDMGVPDEVIERALNHAPRTVKGKHYNHAKHFEALRRALEAWSERLRAIVEGRQLATKLVALKVGGRKVEPH